MAAFDQIVEGVKEVLRMSGEIKRLADAVRELGSEVRDMDRRLVRIETMAELSQSARATRRLPPKT
jgi:methyl-accepting chemotaxis protein